MKIYKFLLSLLFLAAASSAQGDEFRLPEKALVTRVVDGDTIVIQGGLKVRYIGINTPETKHPKKPVEYFGREASEFNKKLVQGRQVNLKYDVQKFDKYGRLLAYVYVDGKFVNAKLVEEGYAQVFTMPPNVKYADLFLGLQRKARDEKRGLWQKY
ncbi:MAG: thermonuclease family protein [Candidatus Omnitrophica bacterium]|nr:thermonuclease family protein [Candidatus Omnitrophota bacterium]